MVLCWVLGLTLVLGICWLTGPLPAGQGETRGPGQAGKDIDKTKQVQQINKLLNTMIDLQDFQQEHSLKESLILLYRAVSDVGGELGILINADAFREENPCAPDIYDTKIKFPPVPPKMAAGEVLRFLLSRVPTNNATLLIKREHVEITTLSKASSAALRATRVLARFDKTPLEDALMEFADQTGATIVIDPRVANQARAPVSANVRTTITLEAAIRLLSDMVELQMTVDGDIIFITQKKAKTAGPKTQMQKNGQAKT